MEQENKSKFNLGTQEVIYSQMNPGATPWYFSSIVVYTHRLATRAWTFCHLHGKFGCRGLVQPHSGQKKSSPKSYQNGRLNGSSNCRMPEVGQMHLEVPWESLFGLKMKIYVEIPHSEQFWFYEKNFGHIWFFWLCLVKIAHFWTILTKTCFCSNDQYIWTKFVLNSI